MVRPGIRLSWWAQRAIRCLLLGIVLLAAEAWSQQPDPAVCAGLEKIRQQHQLPGLVAVLVERGRVTHAGVAGVRKHGEAEAMTVHDQMHLGSCTKAMTATLLAMLVEAGQLQWEAAIGDVLPQLQESMHAQYRLVTIRQLLTHRAGLPENSGRMHHVDDQLTETAQRVALFREVLHEAPSYPPGSEFRYSNLGYMLAGLVAETLTQQPWQDLMRQRLFDPLGMKSAGFGPPGTEGRVDQPWGHRALPLLGLRASQVDNPLVLGPAGRVHASLPDWARFVALHLKHPTGTDRPLLSDPMVDQLHEAAAGEDHALGWGVYPRDWAEGMALSHSGSNTYWYAVVWLSPRRDLAFLAATNVGGTKAAQACDEAVVSLFSYIGDRAGG